MVVLTKESLNITAMSMRDTLLEKAQTEMFKFIKIVADQANTKDSINQF